MLRARLGLVIGSALAAISPVVPAAAAGRVGSVATRAPEMRLTPAVPISSASFTARWRAPGARVTGRRYSVELRISAPRGSLCTTARTLAVRRGWNAGDTLTFRLRADDRTLGADSLWCPGSATLRVVSSRAGTARRTHATLRFRIRADPANPVPTGTAIEAELLDGSLIAVQVAGRPDRTTSLSGKLTGFVLGVGDPGSDVAFRLTAGEISVDGLPVDPLCTANGRTGANRVDLEPAGNEGQLLPGGAFSLMLRIDEDPIGLTGCQGRGGPIERRMIKLSGRGAPDGGLSRVEAGGAIDGVTYADGSQARVALTLVLGFDLSPS